MTTESITKDEIEVMRREILYRREVVGEWVGYREGGEDGEISEYGEDYGGE